MQKKRYMYFIVYAFVLVANVAIVLFQISRANISTFSLPAIFLMIIMVMHAILSFALRHKGNYLMLRGFTQPNPFAEDKDYTFDHLYLKRFSLMLRVYCLPIPFYIPLIFFTSNYVESLGALIPFFAPQVVYIVMGILDTTAEVKEDKLKKQQIERERLEQERRESEGKWK